MDRFVGICLCDTWCSHIKEISALITQDLEILLIQPSVDSSLEIMSRNRYYPPLGLLSIATYLKSKFRVKINVRVLDLDVLSHANLESLVSTADFVGLSVNSFNYNNALEIARIAKDTGATTVLGGVHSRALGSEILRQRRYIDFVIDGEGEYAFSMLVEGVNNSRIPNLVYRGVNGRINANPITEIDLSDIPIIDRSFVDMNRYFHNFKTRNIYDFPFSRPTSIYSHKGCRWRDTNGGCIFCARKDTRFKTRGYDCFWREVRYLKEQYDVDYLWNIADDILGDIKWLQLLIKNRPQDIDVKFLNYARADNISPCTISMLRDFNTHELVVGFETGDPYLMRTAQKGCKIDSNYAAVELLSQSDLLLYPMFVLGLPGESHKTLDNTFRFIESVISSCNVTRFVISFLIPFPGSKAYGMLKSRYQTKYENRDLFLLDESVRDWFRTFTLLESIDIAKERLGVFSKYGYSENGSCQSKYSFEFVKTVAPETLRTQNVA